MWKHYPKEINAIIGYRTKRSMRNADTWKFGNEYCGRLWYRLGLISLLPSLLGLIPFISRDEDRIGMVSFYIIMVQVVLLVETIIPTEIALKKKFS